MKKFLMLFVIAAFGMLFCSSAVSASTLTIFDVDLQSTYFADGHGGTGSGTLNSTTDIAGDPGTQYNVSFSNSTDDFYSIQIGDNFDRPTDNAGVVVAGGDLSSDDYWSITINNPSSTTAFMVGLYLNTGWTDPGYDETDRYYQETKDLTWVNPGSTVTLTMDFNSADYWNGSSWVTGQTVANLNHVSDIGLIVGTNIVNSTDDVDAYHALSGSGIDVNVVPIPAALWLLGSGLIGLIGIRRKMTK